MRVAARREAALVAAEHLWDAGIVALILLVGLFVVLTVL